MSEKTSADLAQEVSDLENSLKEAMGSQEKVDTEENRLAKQILELRIIKKDVELACSKARHNVRSLQIVLKGKTNEFWAAKHSGT